MALLTLAAFAMEFGEFWLLAQSYQSTEPDEELARSMATLKRVPFFTQSSVNDLDKLKIERVFLFISGLDVSGDDVSCLKQLHDKIILDKQEHNKILWIPILDQWSDKEKNEFEKLPSKIPGYSIKFIADKASISLKSINTTISQEIHKLLSYKNGDTCALLMKGSKAVIVGHGSVCKSGGSTFLEVLKELNKVEKLESCKKSFEDTFKEQHEKILKETWPCCRLEISSFAGLMPEEIHCPVCNGVHSMKTREIIVYECCHEVTTSEAL
ncbi:hypothetical protein L484_002320 [Morus notabilis]|uniref:Sieve element occlusion C-terminal domain-containing protein n=1 Tax=Morus notabilis TaxID=981085 RepID=W9R5K7_9ROSA|nr:hypothetical protein L484_002320 [Morus notabilis]